jgi:elongation factor 1-beta
VERFLKMAEIIAKIKIMPEEAGQDMERLKERLSGVVPSSCRVLEWKVEPIAFGLKALIVIMSLPDAEGGTQPVEDAFSRVEGVQSIQIMELSRRIKI